MSVGNDREMGIGEASWSCSHMLMRGHAHTAPDPCPQSHGPEAEGWLLLACMGVECCKAIKDKRVKEGEGMVGKQAFMVLLLVSRS